jgi:transcriptional regulator with XRE-family HTH domain
VSIQNVTLYSQLAARLVGELRRQRNLDQKELASRLGVSPSTWSRVESGEVGLSLDQMAAAASALGTTPGHLISQVDQAAGHLKRRGVTVLTGKQASSDDATYAYLGAAALGAVLLAILAKSK